MKNQTKWTLVLVITVFLVIFFYWLPKMDKEINPVNKIKIQEEYKIIPTTTPSASLEETIKQGYMEGCLENGAVTYEYCTCTYNYLRDKHGLKNLVNMSMELDAEDPKDYPQWLWDAVDNCL